MFIYLFIYLFIMYMFIIIVLCGFSWFIYPYSPGAPFTKMDLL